MSQIGDRKVSVKLRTCSEISNVLLYLDLEFNINSKNYLTLTVKMPRNHFPEGKGIMGAWARLASRAAFRKGQAVYCGHINEVAPGMWSGGVVV